MPSGIPEQNKKPGVCYAWTGELGALPCMELPVIDITHPAFAFDNSAAAVNALIDQFVLSTQRLASMPPAVLQSIIQNSILMRGMLVDSANTYTSGLMTYLNKLGPENLGDGYASPLDRQWAGSLTPLTFRWRMRDVARLLADGIARAVDGGGGARAIHLLNIAGGPAADSLNALILLRKERPELLAGRQVRVTVLDNDAEGPAFGARALEALKADDGPLCGLSAEFAYIPYDWADPAPLRQLMGELTRGDVAAGSSEGGLFEYAPDETIIANLRAIREGTPEGFVMVGPVVRDASTLDPRLRSSEQVRGRPSVRYMGLTALGALANQAGWSIERTLDGPMHQVVSLVKG